MAHALEDLGVDIIEAGFAMASEGDFAAIATITQAVRKPRIASLARAKTEDIEMAARALQFADRARIHVFLASSDLHLEYKLKISRAEALDLRGESVRLARSLVRRCRVLSRGRHPLGPRFSGRDGAHRRRGRGHHHQHARHRGLHHARGVRPHVRRGARARSGHRRRGHRPLLALPRRPGPGRRQLAGRHLRTARARWSAPSTASASAPETPPWKRSPPPSMSAATASASRPASSSKISTPPARCWARSSPSALRPTRPSSATTPSRTSPAFISTACWPTRSATRS